MPRSTTNFDTVRKIGLALPGVEESTAYGSPALKVHGKLLACVPAHRSAEPGSLAVRVDFDDRAELLAADPDVYYVTDHYLNLSGKSHGAWHFLQKLGSQGFRSRLRALRSPLPGPDVRAAEGVWNGRVYR